MSLFRTVGRTLLVNRMLRNRHSRGYGRSSGYGRRRSRGRTGFFGPVPYYSRQTRQTRQKRQTRGGSRVSVGGCCPPIPLALAGGAAARGLLRH